MGFFTKYESLCKSNGLTPTSVALKLGISRAAVTRWKNGALPNGEYLSAIANFFGVSVDYLINDNGNMTDPVSGMEIAKVALFGGDTKVTEDMWNEVVEYVDYVKAKHRRKKDE